ncbi:phage antirepressor KilAC domain-containing protein [Acetivibrio straminisolvens]|jgi:anti-repressor protein|uniref:phage antirepressor KilAC domain-containing protein n=1 Tax=Acetivibrio straminisolvens TaxID=253314 RepID=UPI00223F51E9|nr:phage antirepressor KilAC domain-containing protein [Acetivibrio straminisolvens]
MSELIAIQTNDNMEQVISARELHEKLGIKERFSLWFERIQKSLNIKEEIDYCRHTYTNSNNQTFNDYLLSIDIAKHICMMSGGENAHAIRQYFIQIEKAWNSPEMVMSRALKLAEKKILSLEEERQKLLPKAEAYDTFMDASNLQPMNDVAKCLGIGRNKLFALLREKKIIRSNNTPYQEYIDRRYFEVKEKPIKMGESVINYAQTFVTPKGVDYIARIVEVEKKGA